MGRFFNHLSKASFFIQSSRIGHRRRIRLLTAVCVLAVFSFLPYGCTVPRFGSSAKPFVQVPLEGRAEDILADMKLEHKVGQMLVARLEGSVMPSVQDLRLTGIHCVGGVILPPFQTAAAAARYTTAIYDSAAGNKYGVAPFVITQRPTTMPPPATQFPVPMAMSATGDPDIVRQSSEIAAREMRALGITMAFGPAGDVCTEPTAPCASLNTFGSSPDTVADMVAATVEGYQKGGVVAAVTHFPGLGSVDVTPDKGMSIVVTPVHQFAQSDLLPFRRAVDVNAGAVVVSHVVVPLLDDSLVPASMSPFFLKEMLRTNWRYDGLAIANTLDQPAISGRFSPDTASVNAIKAGADMIVWHGGYSRYIRTLKVVSDAVVNGEIPIDQVNRSVLRILRLKEAYGLLAPGSVSKEIDKKRLAKKDASELAKRVSRRTVTVLKNEGGLLPLDPKQTQRIAFVSLVRPERIVDALRDFKLDVHYTYCHSAKLMKWNPDSTEIDSAVKMAALAQAVIVTIVPYEGVVPTEQRRLLYRLASSGVPVVGIVMGVPTDLSAEKSVTAAVAAYTPAQDNYVNMSSLSTAVDCIFGRASIVLNLPIEMQGRRGRPIEFSLDRLSFSPPGVPPVKVTSMRGPSYLPFVKDKQVRWKFGDGDKARGRTVNHTYDDVGMYKMSVTCTDSFGEDVSSTTTVVVGE